MHLLFTFPDRVMRRKLLISAENRLMFAKKKKNVDKPRKFCANIAVNEYGGGILIVGG